MLLSPCYDPAAGRDSYYASKKREVVLQVDGLNWQVNGTNLDEKRPTWIAASIGERIERQPSRRTYLLKLMVGTSHGDCSRGGQGRREAVVNGPSTRSTKRYSGVLRWFGRRSEYDAGDVLWFGIMRKKAGIGNTDADVRGVFNNLSTNGWSRSIQHRVANCRIWRRIRTWPRARSSRMGNGRRRKEGLSKEQWRRHWSGQDHPHDVFEVWVRHRRKICDRRRHPRPVRG